MSITQTQTTTAKPAQTPAQQQPAKGAPATQPAKPAQPQQSAKAK